MTSRIGMDIREAPEAPPRRARTAVRRKKAARGFAGGRLGQSTIEYVLMVAFGAVFALQIAKFFNDVFQDGLAGLENNVGREMSTGQGFAGE